MRRNTASSARCARCGSRSSPLSRVRPMHLNEDDLVLHYYGEMPSEDEGRAAAHLASCRDCQQHYTTLQRVMAFVDSAPAVEAAPGFERIAWARLEPALAQSRQGGWIARFAFSPTR